MQIEPYDIMEDPARTASPADLRDMLRKILQGELVLLEDPAELLRMDESGKEKRVIYEMRYASFDIREAAVTRGMSYKALEGWCKHALAHARQMFVQEQQNCDWRLVAVKMERKVATMSTLVEFRGQRMEAADAAALQSAGRDLGVRGSLALRQSVEPAPVTEARIEVHVVFADIAGAAITDPTFNLGGDAVPGDMTKYAEERTLRTMPRGLRINRGLAVTLFRRFYGMDPPAPALPPPAMRKRVPEPAPTPTPKPRAPKGKGAPQVEVGGDLVTQPAPPPPMVDKKRVLALLADGVPPAVVARDTGATLEQVMEIGEAE